MRPEPQIQQPVYGTPAVAVYERTNSIVEPLRLDLLPQVHAARERQERRVQESKPYQH